jgi:hypothetical protein
VNLSDFLLFPDLACLANAFFFFFHAGLSLIKFATVLDTTSVFPATRQREITSIAFTNVIPTALNSNCPHNAVMGITDYFNIASRFVFDGT